jgi:integrase
MARPRGTALMLPYVQRFKDRHGRWRTYFRREGFPRVSLPDPVAAPAKFMDAYDACMKADAPSPPARGDAGTFARLIYEYEQSLDFKKLKDSTARVYMQIFEKFAREHGHRKVADMKRKHVEILLASKAKSPGAANSFLKRFKKLMSYALTHDWITIDPTAKVQGFKAGEFHSWTEEQINFFETQWPIGTRQRLAFELALGTAQRRSDLCKMQWRDYDGEFIFVAQEKTGARLQIPVGDDLKFALESTERRGETILTTEYGKPFASAAAFGNFFADAIRKVSLLPRNCSLHGLRKASLRRLAESGCSVHEVQSISGHKTLAEVQRYTKAAEQKQLAKAAMAKQARNKIVKPASA